METSSPINVKIKWKKVIFIFTAGVFLIVFAVVTKVIFNKILISKINSNLVIKPDNSERYKQWRFPTVPITMEFYVFHIVNPHEVRKGMVPFVEERGPYHYKEFLEKRNISFANGKPSVSYNEKKWFTFDKQSSCGLCRDPVKEKVTTINIPFMILSEMAKKYSFLGPIIDVLLEATKEDLFMERSVDEILWGYYDPVFKSFSDLKKKYHLEFIPDISPIMKLQPNDTYDGEVIVNTGRQNIHLTASWEKWKGKENLHLWGSSYANMLNGSDGTQFPPGVTTEDTLYFFAVNLCRSIYLKYESSQVTKGIDVLRYTTPKDLFQNASFNTNNKAFCLTRCYPNGILSGSSDCKPLDQSSIESPIVVSTPHFLIGDPYLQQQVGGLSPNKEKHGLFMNIEPMTGIPLQALIRLQINAYIQPVKSISGTKGIKKSYIPLMWFSNNATVDDSTAKMLLDDMVLPKKVCYYMSLALLIIGSCLIVMACIILVTNLRRNRKSLKKTYLQLPQGKSYVCGINSTCSNNKENISSEADEASTLLQKTTNTA